MFMEVADRLSEYADGQVVWSLVDALRGGIPGMLEVPDEEEEEDDEYIAHSRGTSFASSRRGSEGVSDVFGNSRTLGRGTQGLTFRHRDRAVPEGPRPETNVSF
jgi:hypothetical protein